MKDCNFCDISPDCTGDMIIEEADELGVYLYRDKKGEYYLVQNMLGVTKEKIAFCPMCGKKFSM